MTDNAETSQADLEAAASARRWGPPTEPVVIRSLEELVTDNVARKNEDGDPSFVAGNRVEAAVTDLSTPEQTSSKVELERIDAEIVRVSQKIDDLLDPLPPEDQRDIWQYVTAEYENEKPVLSDEFTTTDGIVDQCKNLFNEIQGLRAQREQQVAKEKLAEASTTHSLEVQAAEQ